MEHISEGIIINYAKCSVKCDTWKISAGFQVFLQSKLRSGSSSAQEFLSKPRPAERLELE